MGWGWPPSISAAGSTLALNWASLTSTVAFTDECIYEILINAQFFGTLFPVDNFARTLYYVYDCIMSDCVMVMGVGGAGALTLPNSRSQ